MKKISLLLSTIFFLILTGNAQILDVKLTTQEMNNWCWAGCSYCILDYYEHTTNQCDIAEFAREKDVATFGTTNCCVNANAGCNKANYLYGRDSAIDNILLHFGELKSNSIANYLSKEDIIRNITCGNLFVVRWGWKSGGGHFVVGHGIQENTVHYMDPWYGEGMKMGSYEWMVEDSRHNWTHTLSVVNEILDKPEITSEFKSINRLEEPISIYKCKSITNADTYKWEITPREAGTIIENDTSMTIEWNLNFNEKYAWLYVSARSDCATSDYSSYCAVGLYSAVSIPEKPTGNSIVCNSENTIYSTNILNSAKSYEWKLEPSTAGTITETSNSINIQWNVDFSGNANLSVAGVNNTIKSEFSEVKAITINAKPEKPSRISGENTICQGTIKTDFSISEVENTTAYIWEILPENAGIITNNGINISVNWKADFAGNASLNVAAKNDCGQSEFSEIKAIIINSKPEKPSEISGENSICQGTENSDFSISEVENSTSYVWDILPENAGIITNNGINISVNWSADFSGNASLKVAAKNDCGQSDFSEIKSITINAKPEKPSNISGENSISQGTANTDFSISEVENTTAYIWEISPENAGTITNNGINISVNWKADFAGNASLKVAAKNDCGQSDFSEIKAITINAKPEKPSTISGENTICQGTANTDFSISEVENATAYLWGISPENAGTITNNGINISVNWSSDFAGNASLKVAAKNDCGQSDFSEIKSISINSKPEKPSDISGENFICQTTIQSAFSITEVKNSTSYIWEISPENAGIITNNGINISVNWSADFSGNVSLKVAAKNDCGQSEFSEIKSFTINPKPEKPSDISGEITICQGTENSVFSISEVENTTAYIWEISPENAGIITNNGINISVNWKADFAGNANLKVAAKNDCGQSDFSEIKSITINSKPEKPSEISGENSICQGTVKTDFSISEVENSTSYVWGILPENAGIITNNGINISVNWSADFSGNASLKVAAKNDCGQSEFSEIKSITINSKPEKPSNISGENTICQGTEKSDFSISEVENSTSYIWEISPENAGTITNNGINISVNWSSDFIGNASLKVAAKNDCGQSEFSEIKAIIINSKPEKPSDISGLNSICQATIQSEFSITEVENTTSYFWKITPKTAGIITNNGTNAIISWNTDFSGEVALKVASLNDCEQSDFSEVKAITINAKPIKPSNIFGENSICQATAQSEFSITEVENATSYVWKITPETAGIITNNGTNTFINWNTDFSGEIALKVASLNVCGQSEFSEIKSITINAKPEKPSNISGENTICQGTENSNFSITEVENSISYVWEISPENAGTITNNGINTIVNWSSDFAENANLKVAAKNDCGQSDFSEIKSITINAKPEKPSDISGENAICQGTIKTDFSISEVENSTSYIWEISPTNAGTITNNGINISVNWKADFAGNASLKVAAKNDCGQSEFSEIKAITINAKPEKPSDISGENSISQGTANTDFSISEVENTTAYVWEILPTSAGTIINNGTNVTVNWKADFSGNVKLKVAAKNDCGQSDFSDDFDIEIKSNASTENHKITSLKIYPNPSKGLINIQSENTDIEIFIYDTSGKQVFHKNKFKNKKSIQTNLKSGLYLVKIISENKQEFRRIVISK